MLFPCMKFVAFVAILKTIIFFMEKTLELITIVALITIYLVDNDPAITMLICICVDKWVKYRPSSFPHEVKMNTDRNAKDF